jgi:hypothetical protein
MCKHICCIGNIFNNILTALSSGTLQARTGKEGPAIKFRRQLLSIYALDHPYKFLIATFGCSRHDIAMARQHAYEHGPGQEAPVEVHTRPGRTIEAGFYDIVSFIGNPENLHRLPSTQGKGIKDEYILLKRKRLRSTLYREFCAAWRIAGKRKMPAESFFYSVFERIDGVKFSDREATECGCPHCIGMVKWGWEEITRILEQMLPLLDIDDVTRYELKVMFERQLEASRRWLDHGYGGDLTNECDGIDSHCMKYALLPAEDDHTGHVDVQRLPMGWARKSGVERCDKETRERRTEWVRRFYAERVRRNLRANEYEAEDQLIKEYPDDDSMWLGSAALKSVFGKLSAARKEEAKKKAAVTAGGQVGGAQQVAGGDVEGPQVGAQVGAQEGATEAEDEEDELEALLEYQIPPDVGINYDSDDSGDEGETMETEEEEEIVEAGAVDTCL